MEVTVRFAVWRFPDPVALVNVMPVEETVVPRSVVIERFVPVAFVNTRLANVVDPTRSSLEETTPLPDTEKTVDELTCRSMKLPLKPEAKFEPSTVPVTLESWMVLGPKRANAELVETGGVPERNSAVAADWEDWM